MERRREEKHNEEETISDRNEECVEVAKEGEKCEAESIEKKATKKLNKAIKKKLVAKQGESETK